MFSGVPRIIGAKIWFSATSNPARSGTTRDCPSCAIDAPTYCYNFFPHNWSGTRADGSPVMFKDGEPMNANFFGQSSFATHAIVPQRTAVKMDKDLPLLRAVVPDEFTAVLVKGRANYLSKRRLRLAVERA